MKFELMEINVWDEKTQTYSKTETKDVWRMESAEGRFTADGEMSEAEVNAAYDAGQFRESKYSTGDGRKVFTLPFKPKVKKSFEVADKVTVGAAPVYKSVKIEYLD